MISPGRASSEYDVPAQYAESENDKPTMSATPQAHSLDAIQTEINRRLQRAIDELFPPLSSVALAHVRDVQPFVRAAIVCTTADELQRTLTTSEARERLLEQALTLGSALEMLVVALSIHRLLLLPSAGDTLDRALVGSTILAGDYCFSRAASMAAQTESPQVVDLFSRALQQVSEASLRGFFGGQNTPWEEDTLLSVAGVEAICILAGTNAPNADNYPSMGRALASRDWNQVSSHPLMRRAEAVQDDPRRAAWQELAGWIKSTSHA